MQEQLGWANFSYVNGGSISGAGTLIGQWALNDDADQNDSQLKNTLPLDASIIDFVKDLWSGKEETAKVVEETPKDPLHECLIVDSNNSNPRYDSNCLQNKVQEQQDARQKQEEEWRKRLEERFVQGMDDAVESIPEKLSELITRAGTYKQMGRDERTAFIELATMSSETNQRLSRLAYVPPDSRYSSQGSYRGLTEKEIRANLHPAELKLWDSIKAYGLVPILTVGRLSQGGGWGIGMKLPPNEKVEQGQ